ncbi:MAG: hypothetical protein J0M34_07310 [Alphaproteobacteria bacterium]|nr:hypothetical protein [Alphaproteobacteria bacterium]
MSSMNKLRSKIASAIQAADSSYFNENYTKQADAVLKAIANEGFVLLPKELAPELWKQVSDNMRTGRLKPEEHVKDVFETVIRTAATLK